MADPTDATTIPHLIGIILSGTTPIATSNVIAYNRTTGDRIIKPVDSAFRVVFDLSNLTSGYTAGDVIDFENVGGSYGGTTVTVNATRVLQTAALTSTTTPAFTRSL